MDDGALASSSQRLSLMTKILQSLDDQCKLGDRGSDDEFCQQIGNQYTIRGVCQLEQRGTFSINHYAGRVIYTTEGFVLKNSDAMHADMQACMRTCQALEPVYPKLFPDDEVLSSRTDRETSEVEKPDDNKPTDISAGEAPPPQLASPRSKGVLGGAMSLFGGKKRTPRWVN